MQHYKVQLTKYALRQINETVLYISQTLYSPESAANWQEKLYRTFDSLKTLPERYVLVDMEPWKSKGLRKMPFENYVIYYQVKAGTHVVLIVAVVYGKRNQFSALREMKY